MSTQNLIPAQNEYLITAYADGEHIANRIIAFCIDEEGVSAVTAGAGVEDCETFHHSDRINGLVDGRGMVACGGLVFNTIASFLRYAKNYFADKPVEAPPSGQIGQPNTEQAESFH